MEISVFGRATDASELRRSFDVRFAAARPRLLAICRSVIGVDEAEDVVQETYLKADARLHQLRNPQLFEAWLTRIAFNEARSLWRQRKRSRASAVDERVVRDERPTRNAALRELVDRLPVRERMCVVLHYGHGYSVREIAQLLGVSPINTRTILFRARRRLKRDLENTSHGQ